MPDTTYSQDLVKESKDLAYWTDALRDAKLAIDGQRFNYGTTPELRAATEALQDVIAANMARIRDIRAGR